MTRGVVVIWSCGAPRLVAHRIPAAGLALGAELIPDDPGLRGDHARVTDESGTLALEDLAGDVSCSHLSNTLAPNVAYPLRELPAYVQIAQTVIAIVDDVERFEDVTWMRVDELYVAGSLGPAVRALDAAANAEEHVLIVGGQRIATRLATRYANVHGRHARFRPGGDEPLDHFLSTRESVRTVVIDLVRSVPEYDLVALAHWLETDVRFVTLSDGKRFDWIPPAIHARATRIDLPHPRFDEIPAFVAERVEAAHPGMSVTARAILRLLELLSRTEEDQWFEAFEHMLVAWRPEAWHRQLRRSDIDRAWR